MRKHIYADCAATSQVSDVVMEAMIPWFRIQYGNPSGLHSLGRKAADAISKARRQLSDSIGAEDGQVIFTSGGTEANNWAIRSLAAMCGPERRHFAASTIEHASVIKPLDQLCREGYTSSVLVVDADGMVDMALVEEIISQQVGFVSVMFANNEIGTIQPIRELGRICRQASVLLHVDAVQAFGKIPVDVVRDNIDLMSISAHKLHGPKGIGALYIGPRASSLPPLFFGGGQENGLRSGTESVSGIVGFGAAAHAASASLTSNLSKVTKLRNRMISSILQIPGTRLNGHPTARLPGNANFSISGVESDALILNLDWKERVAASSSSACSSSSVEASHVLLAIGAPADHASLRLSIDDMTGPKEVEHICSAVRRVVEELRRR